jgi:hypothetical protein
LQLHGFDLGGLSLVLVQVKVQLLGRIGSETRFLLDISEVDVGIMVPDAASFIEIFHQRRFEIVGDGRFNRHTLRRRTPKNTVEI